MKFYTLSPNVPENPVLFPMMRPTIIEQGHSFVGNVGDCDVVLWDMHTRISDYDQSVLDKIVSLKLPVISFDEYDRGGLSTEGWPQPLTPQMESFWVHMTMLKMGKAHFCRLMDKTLSFPKNVYPFEKPILFEQGLVSPDDLFNRPYDIVFIANSAPQREHLKRILELNAKLKCKIVLGGVKMPFHEWVDEHRNGKLFISWSAGGYSDERMQALFSVAGIIRENNDQLLPHDLRHLHTAVRLSSIPTKEDLGTLVQIVNNKGRLYDIYKNGYEFMKAHYSKEAIAKYFLDKIIKHCS